MALPLGYFVFWKNKSSSHCTASKRRVREYLYRGHVLVLSHVVVLPHQRTGYRTNTPIMKFISACAAWPERSNAPVYFAPVTTQTIFGFNIHGTAMADAVTDPATHAPNAWRFPHCIK
jgi:hypothetical protein